MFIVDEPPAVPWRITLSNENPLGTSRTATAQPPAPKLAMLNVVPLDTVGVHNTCVAAGSTYFAM